MDEGLINYLSAVITQKRKDTFEQVLKYRTRYFTVVLEDIYQPHNASAVLRSCDCFGIQDVHIIENKNEYHVNPDVTLGSNKWLTIKRYNQKNNNTLQALEHLKTNGYRLVATTPHKNKEVKADVFDVEKGKTALIFGSELNGITRTVMENADEFLQIPMYGFTESFNISVSAAIILQILVKKLHDSNINWHVSGVEKQEIMLQWLRNSIKHPGLLEKEYYQINNSNVE